MVFNFLKKAALGMTADLIAKKASSPEAFDGGATTAFSTKDAAERFFERYGSSERKFKFHTKPPFYIGYVKIPGHEEFLSIILMQADGSVVASFNPETGPGQDMVSLIARKAFADKVAAQFIGGAVPSNRSSDRDHWTYITNSLTPLEGYYPDKICSSDYTAFAEVERLWNKYADAGYPVLSVDEAPTDHVRRALERWVLVIRWRFREGDVPAIETQGLFEDDYCFEQAEICLKETLRG